MERGLEGSLFGARIEVELIQDRLPKRLLKEGAVGAFAVVILLCVAAEIGPEDPSGADGQEVLVDYGIEPEISIRDQRLDRARKVVAANGLDAGPGRRVAEEGKPFRAQSRPVVGQRLESLSQLRRIAGGVRPARSDLHPPRTEASRSS